MSEIDPHLRELHDLMVGHFLRLIKSGETTSAQDNVIRQFLKDNDVTAVALLAESTGFSSPLLQLVDKLPYTDPEEAPLTKESIG